MNESTLFLDRLDEIKINDIEQALYPVQQLNEMGQYIWVSLKLPVLRESLAKSIIIRRDREPVAGDIVDGIPSFFVRETTETVWFSSGDTNAEWVQLSQDIPNELTNAQITDADNQTFGTLSGERFKEAFDSNAVDLSLGDTNLSPGEIRDELAELEDEERLQAIHIRNFETAFSMVSDDIKQGIKDALGIPTYDGVTVELNENVVRVKEGGLNNSHISAELDDDGKSDFREKIGADNVDVDDATIEDDDTDGLRVKDGGIRNAQIAEDLSADEKQGVKDKISVAGADETTIALESNNFGVKEGSLGNEHIRSDIDDDSKTEFRDKIDASGEIPSITPDQVQDENDTTQATISGERFKEGFDHHLGDANLNDHLTDTDIKEAYERNDDTNAFRDADETKLDGQEDESTADQTPEEIAEAMETRVRDEHIASDLTDEEKSNIRTKIDANEDVNVDDVTIEEDADGSLRVKVGGLRDEHVASDLTDNEKQEYRGKIEAADEDSVVNTSDVGSNNAITFDNSVGRFRATGISLPATSETEWLQIHMEVGTVQSAEWHRVELQALYDLGEAAVGDTQTDSTALHLNNLFSGSTDVVLGRTSANDLLIGYLAAGVPSATFVLFVKKIGSEGVGVSSGSTDITIVADTDRVSVESSSGADDDILAADTDNAGVMTADMFDRHESLARVTTESSVPSDPLDGDIHIYDADASSLSNHRNNADTADVTTANAGDHFKYNGTNWVLEITSSEITVDDATIENDATNGLQVKAEGIDDSHISDALTETQQGDFRTKIGADTVDVDGVTIEDDETDGLRVKDGGIDSDALADESVRDEHVSNDLSNTEKDNFKAKLDIPSDIVEPILIFSRSSDGDPGHPTGSVDSSGVLSVNGDWGRHIPLEVGGDHSDTINLHSDNVNATGVARYDGKTYVVDNGTAKKVFIYDASNTYESDFELHADNGDPQGITVTPTGRIFIPDGTGEQFFEYNTSGTHQLTHDFQSGAFITGAASDEHYLYFLNSSIKQVYTYFYGGGLAAGRERSVPFTGAHNFHGIAYENGRDYVLNSTGSTHEIRVYRNGVYLSSESQVLASGNTVARGLEIDGQLILVIDNNDNQIYVYGDEDSESDPLFVAEAYVNLSDNTVSFSEFFEVNVSKPTIDDSTIGRNADDELEVKEGGIREEHVAADLTDDGKQDFREKIGADNVNVDNATIEDDTDDGLRVKEGGLDNTHIDDALTDSEKEDFRDKLGLESVSDSVQRSEQVEFQSGSAIYNTNADALDTAASDPISVIHGDGDPSILSVTAGESAITVAKAGVYFFDVIGSVDPTNTNNRATPGIDIYKNDETIGTDDPIGRGIGGAYHRVGDAGQHFSVMGRLDIDSDDTIVKVVPVSRLPYNAGEPPAFNLEAGMLLTVSRVGIKGDPGDAGDPSDVDDVTIEVDSSGNLSVKDDGITLAKMADDSVGQEQVLDDAIGTEHYQVDSVDNDALGLEAVRDENVADDLSDTEKETFLEKIGGSERYHHTVDRVYEEDLPRTGAQYLVIDVDTGNFYHIYMGNYNSDIIENFLNSLGRRSEVVIANTDGSADWTGHLDSVFDDDETSATLRVEFLAADRTGTFTDGENITVSFGYSPINEVVDNETIERNSDGEVSLKDEGVRDEHIANDLTDTEKENFIEKIGLSLTTRGQEIARTATIDVAVTTPNIVFADITWILASGIPTGFANDTALTPDTLDIPALPPSYAIDGLWAVVYLNGVEADATAFDWGPGGSREVSAAELEFTTSPLYYGDDKGFEVLYEQLNSTATQIRLRGDGNVVLASDVVTVRIFLKGIFIG